MAETLKMNRKGVTLPPAFSTNPDGEQSYCSSPASVWLRGSGVEELLPVVQGQEQVACVGGMLLTTEGIGQGVSLTAWYEGCTLGSSLVLGDHALSHRWASSPGQEGGWRSPGTS